MRSQSKTSNSSEYQIRKNKKKTQSRGGKADLLSIRIELVVGDVGHDLVALLAPGVGLDQEQRKAQGDGREDSCAELHDGDDSKVKW